MTDEQYVNRHQHRADLSELRGELKEEIAGLRQDVAVIAKAVEMGFTELRQQMTQLHQQMRDMHQELRQDIRDVRTTSQRQLWVLIAVVIVTMVGGISVAERSFSLNDGVEMFVKPMPQPILRRRRQLQDEMRKTQGLKDFKIATRIHDDMRAAATKLVKHQGLTRLVGKTCAGLRVGKQMGETRVQLVS